MADFFRPGAGPAAALSLLALLASCGGDETSFVESAPAVALPEPGRWQGSLLSPGGPLTFGIEFAQEEAGLRAILWNGEERRPAGLAYLTPDGVAIPIPPYRSRLIAKLEPDGAALVGYWERDRGEGPVPVLPFAAVKGGPKQRGGPGPAASAIAEISGRWKVQFEGDADVSVGVFDVDPEGVASGTFLTTLGDYRYLSGRFDGQTLLLSCFDGAHAFLFQAELAEGMLAGDFWSRDSYHTTWGATKDPDAALPDDFALTSWVEGTALADLSFPDLTGTERTLDDPAFVGDARLLVVFGSWCPNCNDLTEYLVELDRRYEGLSVLGIAFELGDDPARMRTAVEEYMSHHGATYPVLLGGTSDKKQASAALPILDRVRAYPTTVFMDREGNVSGVHTGFMGPATGKDHDSLRQRFESKIESLLAGE